MNGAFVSVNEFRRKMEHYLLHAQRPVVISHRGMPMGYFIPARIWHDRDTVEIYAELVSATLEMSGYDEQDIERTIESFAQANAGVIRERLQRHLDQIDAASGRRRLGGVPTR